MARKGEGHAHLRFRTGLANTGTAPWRWTPCASPSARKRRLSGPIRQKDACAPRLETSRSGFVNRRTTVRATRQEQSTKRKRTARAARARPHLQLPDHSTHRGGCGHSHFVAADDGRPAFLADWKPYPFFRGPLGNSWPFRKKDRHERLVSTRPRETPTTIYRS
jgi:hypothetical protein